ncbi:gluconeogenesis factor YvcK family protein [Streptomyces sp. NBC_00059]|uniref:gluconeogenesis factor YvcK family protein n=1 Tax=Streptomyces sp. NBC_00059 TaxID=2975635 RepID=UPI0022527FB5|nr:gluconeogenesis factor YvcK family protein [Streptomyces sp. NBC_00059]MCX5416150.1 YvcK family protein [Streptomyces sp. NBC_00059]
MTTAERARGTPRVVVIGGGRGLTATVRAARRYAGHTTAVVTTADDSGSTGRLRASMSIPAPGDIRRCLLAMAGVEDDPIGKAFEYRFPGTDLDGHALGNLVLAGLATVRGGFTEGVGELAALLGVHPDTAQVFPATADPVGLRATTVDGHEVVGQYAVSQTAGLHRVALHPPGCGAPDGVVDAILRADQVVMGPGSVYTSVLAAALVPDVFDALNTTAARKVYVCNLEPERAETTGYDVAAHVAALMDHGVKPDLVLVSSGGTLPLDNVKIDVVQAPLALPDGCTHDSVELAAALAGLLP